MRQPPLPSRHLFVVSAPSGTGKTSLIKALLAEDRGLVMSVSLTTRAPRPGEVHGQDYFFHTQSQAQDMIASGKMLEYAEVFDHIYGTPAGPVQEALCAGRDVIADVDWQGAEQIRQRFQGPLTTIFIVPPSLEALRVRLEGRNQDAAEVIEKRLAAVSRDLLGWSAYDYVLVNDDFDKALQALAGIVSHVRHHQDQRRRARQILQGFLIP